MKKWMESIKKSTGLTKKQMESIKKWLMRGLKAITVFVLFIIIIRIIIVTGAHIYTVYILVNVIGMDPFLAKGLVALFEIPFLWAVLEVTRLLPKIIYPKSGKRRKKSYRKLGFLVISLYIAFFFLSVYFLKQGVYFGIKRIAVSNEVEFFNTITGEPKVWYYKDEEGNYEFFQKFGFHPIKGEKLKPVTAQIVSDYMKIFEQREKYKRIKERLSKKKANIERYVNPVISNSYSRIEIAVLVGERKNMNLSESSRITCDKIGEKLTRKNIKTASNLFKDEFITEGNFKNLYYGNIQDISDLELINHVDYLILGTKDATFSQDPRLEDLISCAFYLDLKIYSSRTGKIISSNSFNEPGIGIDKEKAEQQAVDRIVMKVESYVISKIKNKGA